MPVVHREHPADSPHPIRSAILEDILRDAACFTTEGEAPQGLAHRALARQIAAQSALKGLPSVRASRKQSAALWFGGLSAGTLAGAAAAVLIIANLNGNAFRITPEAASLPTSLSQESGTKSFAMTKGETPSGTASLPGPHQPAAFAGASLVTVSKESAPAIRLPARYPSERELPYHSERWDRPIEQDSLPTPRGRRLANHPASPTQEQEHTASPVTRWKTEPFEETEYQLVTAAYTPEPASGGYANGFDHVPLTPLKMRTSFNTPGSDPMTDPPLPQY